MTLYVLQTRFNPKLSTPLLLSHNSYFDNNYFETHASHMHYGLYHHDVNFIVIITDLVMNLSYHSCTDVKNSLAVMQ